MTLTLVEGATEELIGWARTIETIAIEPLQRAKQLVTRLGAHVKGDYAEIGFWAPELIEKSVPQKNIFLEVLDATAPIDFDADEQTIEFQRQRVHLRQHGEYLWGVVSGMTPGTREQVGSFYWIRYQDREGKWHTIHDHFAYSVPFGTLAPAELYDIGAMQEGRGDKAHFPIMDFVETAEDGIPRVGPPVNILQIHPGTASAEGTLAGLTRIYAGIAEKRRHNTPLTPFEENFVGYDAIQLMPVEPPIEHEAGPLFWETDGDDRNAESISVTLRKHDITNWGYDVMVSAAPAINPAILGSKRPDELLDLIVELHNFPDGPIKFMFDIVYGHTDNQAVKLFSHHYLAGPNMYGQNLEYLRPVVRATWLEMMRRKHNYGVDGIRVDGAQDFKFWDAAAQMMYHDDEFLREMNDIVQEVAGVRYRPWMIFEDGRPWPRDDWELASTYREITKQFPNVWQWGPLTFAHNTPFLFTFWLSKMWRIREITHVGSHWITGCANHDTLRRGTQVPINSRINTRLGNSLPEVFQQAYDNPAARMFDYCAMPGVPMDFVNALMRAPWSFIRNTDDRYGVKVVSEESRFLYWGMPEERYTHDDVFPRLKAMGFTDLHETRRFFHVLEGFVEAAENKLDVVANLMNLYEPSLPGPHLDTATLKEIANAWMADVFEYCRAPRYIDQLDPQRTAFNLSLREFRQARPWMMDDLRDDEFFGYRDPANGTALFYSLRRAPDGSEEVLFIANMEGETVTLIPSQMPIPGLEPDGWTLALKAPSVYVQDASQSLALYDSQGLVFTRAR